jgi:beta-barrel assembly-enhancing protease
VQVSLEREGLVIAGPAEGETASWPYVSINPIEDEAGGQTVRLGFEDARLTVADAGFRAALAAAAPHLGRPSLTSRSKRVMLLIALTAAVAGAAWWGVPRAAGLLAGLLPASAESRLGDTVVAGFGARRCSTPEGHAALRRLTDRLVANTAVPYTLDVSVIDQPEVNAFAAPGGRIALMHGLLKSAQSPDEVAGVLAHELGHTLHRHPTQALIRVLGINIFLDLAVGSGAARNGASLAELIVAFSYSRANEAEADAEARRLLERSGIGTAGLVAFFARLAEQEKGPALPAYLSSHPALGERIAALGPAAAGPGAPALSAEDWQALRTICD